MAEIATESLWEKALENVLNVFGIPSLYDEQKDVLSKFFSKQDVIVNLPTFPGVYCQNFNKGGSLIYITSRVKNVEVKRKSNFVRTADF